MAAPTGQANTHLKPPARLTSLRASVSMIDNPHPARAPSNPAPLSRANTMHAAAPPTRSISVHPAQSLKRFNSLFSTASSLGSTVSLAASDGLPATMHTPEPQALPIPEIYANPEVFPTRARSWSTATTILEFEDDATERGQSYGTLDTPTPSQYEGYITRPDRVDHTVSRESSFASTAESSSSAGTFYPFTGTLSSSSLQPTESIFSTASTASTVLEQALDYDSDQISWEEIIIPVPAL